MTEYFLNDGLVRSILGEMDKAEGDNIALQKPVLRSMGYELLRLWALEKMPEKEKCVFIQRLSIEYTVAHISDMIRNMGEDGLETMSSKDVLTCLLHNLEDMGREVAVKAGGHT